MGQAEMLKQSNGMLIALIDWSCLQSVGVNGRFLRFCRPYMKEACARLRLKDSLVRTFR